MLGENINNIHLNDRIRPFKEQFQLMNFKCFMILLCIQRKCFPQDVNLCMVGTLPNYEFVL